MTYPDDYSTDVQKNEMDLKEFKEKAYLAELESKVLRLELKNKDITRENVQIKKENEILKRELDKLRIPPLILGTVLDRVNERKAVVKSSTGPNFLVNLSQFVEPDDIVPGARVCLNQQTLAVVEVLPKEKDYRAMAMELEEKPDILFGDIGGLNNQIRDIKEVVELPLKNPELFEKVGIVPPKGVLLYGPPGTGKTLLAKAVARETNASFVRVVGSELVKKFIGEGAKLVRDVFKLAKEKSPCIIFIDEIDAVASKRTESLTGGDREVQRTLMQLLAEMDGFDSRGDVKIIAATNRPDILDPAILRPGRFDRIIEIAAPDEDGRLEIFKIHTDKMNIKSVDLREIAKMAENMVGADIKAVCTEAGMFAIREGREYVTTKDFKEALLKVTGKKEKSEEGIAHLTTMYG
ncbi:26S proteasome subunit P45 family [Methanococcus vannielii SB]|uniref:Proteasome-activating nucleotidase n=1 Tax=Methanococcus vannielii (strain ATCC 35089 / DSM 1224 / JCM 13029 / OCM 148 / SB) TaxID=406327 RepID=PAN_METVS|nr:proteasome-activating nucleotidase [Methanococcus vannielii]A6UQT3.1 RecName: Full=Proteasome-activating nucleotidase; Short=PAN; AltName: Full=Proteasomal ATPase; AltName: Full=Proteasome regulatory ATPase; AltName: Full=Proteasome regulatory particle [Methanococcus vannielii SB]ABR54855.1 26S proteasome subunit P45 family [Methanococcus vannielii SB]